MVRLGECRTIRISGYHRGDFAAGLVPGLKVLVASDRHVSNESDEAPSV